MRTQIYIPDDLGERIERMKATNGLNVSAVCQEALLNELKRRRGTGEPPQRGVRLGKLVAAFGDALDYAMDHQGRLTAAQQEELGQLYDRLEGLEL